MRPVGELTVYWGSMFSGKTTALIRDLMYCSKFGGYSVCFKPTTDNRDNQDIIKTHDGTEFPATIIERPSEIFYLLDYRVTHIGIEEASLFLGDPTLIPTIETLREMGFKVIVTGLDLTAEGKPFGQMPNIAALADNCYKLHTKCVECDETASISHFKGSKKGVIEVGGTDKYEPLCRNCWSKKR